MTQDNILSPYLLRKSQRDGLHTAHHTLIQNKIFINKIRERPSRSRHQHRLQCRERVSRFGKHASGNKKPNIIAGFFVIRLRAEPMVKTDGVKLTGLGVGPRLLRPNLSGERI